MVKKSYQRACMKLLNDGIWEKWVKINYRCLLRKVGTYFFYAFSVKERTFEFWVELCGRIGYNIPIQGFLCVPGQPSWSSKGQSHWSSSRSLTDHWPASNRPFSRSTAQTAAGVIEITKWRPCNHEKCGYKVFFYVNNKLCTDKKA